jgi:N6-adenosine-specific RNA methylase IME4
LKYRTIVADPPSPQPLVGKYQRRRHASADDLPYQTMTLQDIAGLQVAGLAESGAHLWLWTTNAFLRAAFDVMEAWGFTYLTTVTWVKPSGCGAWFVGRTQHVLFGYRERCEFPLARYQPNVFFAAPKEHSAKPEGFTDWIETISPEPRVELFARRHRLGWDVWGNESANTAQLATS